MTISFDSVFCDDIRQETNGKFILIGVYSEKLIAPLPIDLRLCIWIRAKGIEKGSKSVNFAIVGPDGVEVKATVKFTSLGPDNISTIILHGVPIRTKEEGAIEVIANFDGTGKYSVGRLPVANTEQQAS